MAPRPIPNVGSHRIETLNGDEVFSVKAKSQTDADITAANLKAYIREEVAAPSLRLERGSRAVKISELPNASEMGEEDRITGIQNGGNVNFSRAQLLAPLVEIVRLLIAEELAYRDKAATGE